MKRFYTDQFKSPAIHIQVVIAALLYNLLHMLAWELSMAYKLGWLANVIGSIVVILVSIISILLLSQRRKIGLYLAMIPVAWAIAFQWFVVYVLAGHTEPNGVWWYPVFPIFQGGMIVYFAALILKGVDVQYTPLQNDTDRLISPSIYLQAVSAFLLVQTGQKFVREMVVGYGQSGTRGALLMLFIALMEITAAIMVLKRIKFGLKMAVTLGALLLMQPVIYHIILGQPCLGGIWWYPFFTAIEGAFIVYFSRLVFDNEKKLRGQESMCSVLQEI